MCSGVRLERVGVVGHQVGISLILQNIEEYRF